MLGSKSTEGLKKRRITLKHALFGVGYSNGKNDGSYSDLEKELNEITEELKRRQKLV